MSISVETRDPILRTLLRDRYAQFCTDEPPDVLVTIDVHTEMQFDMDELLRSRHQVPRVVDCGTSFEMLGRHFEARLNDRHVRISGPRSTYPIDFTLAFLWQRRDPNRFMLHGAGISDGERGWIASGPSGCGKSSLARLLGQHALCDEFVGVVRRSDCYQVMGLPFWQGRNGLAELQHICFLGHGITHSRKAMTKENAWKALRKQVVWPLHDPAAAGRTLGNARELLETVPCFELSFALDAGVWDLIREAA